MKNWLLLFLVCLSLQGFTQSSADILDLEHPNLPYLEQLTLNEINKIRLEKNKIKLLPDSVLLDAAKNHASFIAKKNKLTHYQKENKSLKDPQLRAEYFGAHDLQIGENILMFPLGVSVQMHDKKQVNPKTYQDYAAVLAKVWMNSKPHRANILTNDFKLTAVAIVFSQNNDTLFAVQLFGDPMNEHEYVFPAKSFPYSKLGAEKKNILFEPDKIKSIKKYPYGIKTPVKFSDCPKSSKKKWLDVDANLNITRDKMLLCVYDLNQIRNFFSGSKDGLAVELISFKNQYSCGNEYEVQANSRNGFSYIDGKLMKPIYRSDIEKQLAELIEKASKRKKSKSDEKTCNYFDLGDTPEGFTDYPYEVKLHYIRNKKFCVQVEFDHHCGELLVYKPATLPVRYTIDTLSYTPSSAQTSLMVEVGFEKNAIEFNGVDIAEVLDQLKNKEFKVNSIQIEAFASIEGSAKANEKLFKKRADVLIAELGKYQSGKIKYSLTTKENWELFYQQIDTTEHYSMRVWKRERVKQFFKDSANALFFEPLFEEQRKARITLIITPVQNNKWKQLMARTEWNSIMSSFEVSNSISDEQIERLDIIQCYLQTQSEAGESIVNPEELNVPDLKLFSKAQYRAYLFGISNGKSYDAQVAVERLKRWNSTLGNREVDYNIKAIIANYSDEFSSKEKIQLIKSLLAELKAQEANQKLIDDIEMWFNVEMANLIYRGHENDFIDRAETSLLYINKYYLKQDSSVSRKLDLAKYYISFEKFQWAREILEPMVHIEKPNKEAIVLYVKYCLEYEIDHFPATYHAELKRAHENLSEKQWCSLFIGTCNIPLRVLDWPSLRSFYCQSCVGK